MKLSLDLEKESIEDLQKCIEILKKVIDNKNNNRPLTEGLEEYDTKKTDDSMRAKRMQDQEKLMDSTDLSVLGGKD